MEEVIRSMWAGFILPWRLLKRAYWRRKFNRVPQNAQKLARLLEIDPDSLIEKGLL